MAHTIETRLGAAAGAVKATLGALKIVRRVVVKCMDKLVIWQERSEQRHALSELNERMLKDIGVSSGDAYLEARKPFWQP